MKYGEINEQHTEGYTHNRKICLRYGNRRRIISSINADRLKNYDVTTDITGNIENNQIDIACVRETHNDRKDCGNAPIIQLLLGEMTQPYLHKSIKKIMLKINPASPLL